jgi:predicted secreted protein
MNWFSGAVVYIILWWLVFFLSLPIGIHSVHETGGAGEAGHDAGAPVRHHLKWKLLAATVIAALLWGIAYWIISSDMLSFRAR